MKRLPDPLYGLIMTAVTNPQLRDSILIEVNKLTLDYYQEKAMETAVFPEDQAVAYCALGLGNEAGEVQGKIKKIIRGDYVNDPQELHKALQDISDEIGDVLWYAAALCDSLGISLDTIAKKNIRKLADRKERGVLKGSGDTR